MKKAFLLFTMAIAHFMMGQTMGVMTYNIRYDNPKDGLNSWDNRKENLIAQVNFYAPEVLGTQEGLLHQLKDLENGLGGYAFFGVGRDDGKEQGEYTAIYYQKDNLELLDKGTFWLSLSPEKPSKAWDAALPRICTYGLFRRKADGSKFYVFNTHFDHVGETAREESAALILRKIKELNSPNFPVVLMGDFNMEYNSPGIQLITKVMQDTHISAGNNSYGPEGTYNGFDVTKPVNGRIDYIFCSRGTKILKSGILSAVFNTRYPSDHLPVYVQLAFE